MTASERPVWQNSCQVRTDACRSGRLAAVECGRTWESLGLPPKPNWLALPRKGTADGARRWSLPPARGARLADYRFGYVLDDPVCPVTAEVGAVLG